jgi:hypothetical protein
MIDPERRQDAAPSSRQATYAMAKTCSCSWATRGTAAAITAMPNIANSIVRWRVRWAETLAYSVNETQTLQIA